MTDENYKRTLMKAMGENPEDYHKLDAIVGPNEFVSFLNQNKNNYLAYAQTDDFRNVQSRDFRANFHIHTTNSDGVMPVWDLLNLAEEYGKTLSSENKGKFYFAITDHNTTNGDIDALNLLISNPQKYKHIGLVLGVEASAMFTSVQAKTSSEVHLLSYALNPFEDTITALNQQRLQAFQNNVNNALDNANKHYSACTQKYGFDFNFEDMAKIRPSIKNCPSNVSYSMKDYLQFRLIYAELVENNTPLKKYLLTNGIALNTLDFAEPKNMITIGELRPYWKNYQEMIKKYLESQLSANNHQIKIADLVGNVSENLENTLENIEHTVLNSASDMYIKEPNPLTFEEVTSSFASSKTAVSGIAHGAYYEYNNPHQKLFLQDLYRSFKERLSPQTIIGEKHYPYAPYIDTKFTNGLIDLYGYLPSGGLDSHKNNFFTPQTSYKRDFLEEIMGVRTNLPSQKIKE